MPPDDEPVEPPMTEAPVLTLVHRRKRMMVKLLASLTTIMVAPPVIAGIFGSLGLAVVVGVLSLFAGLIGMALIVSKWEFFERRAEATTLPKARLLDRN
jgi:hypothetical protein